MNVSNIIRAFQNPLTLSEKKFHQDDENLCLLQKRETETETEGENTQCVEKDKQRHNVSTFLHP